MVLLLAPFPDVGLVELSKLLNYLDAEPQDVAGRTPVGTTSSGRSPIFFRECGYDDTVGFDGFSEELFDSSPNVDSGIFLLIPIALFIFFLKL